ncbi:universal stress protein [Pseudochryseolinea flava]|uniref:UspA domain-containing protein n=1 Tax=Pseudochryseolinea flava TaxID=2059302 RepID=A0A364Y5X4_9BACT|nr:universal stress protein [Pseudochryseolinea flava]RAW02388.1 hypothetical protein DQQ10_07600 [Pseudochryseolinea flava]
MRTILCVIDLTEPTLQVLRFAADLAKAQKAYLSILFPYRLITQGNHADASKLRANLEQQAFTNFGAFKNNIPALDSIPFEFKPEIGFAGYIIGSFVRRHDVAMVIIGQDQARTINDSNGMSLEHLIENLKVPVTIIPEESAVKASIESL